MSSPDATSHLFAQAASVVTDFQRVSPPDASMLVSVKPAVSTLSDVIVREHAELWVCGRTCIRGRRPVVHRH